MLVNGARAGQTWGLMALRTQWRSNTMVLSEGKLQAPGHTLPLCNPWCPSPWLPPSPDVNLLLKIRHDALSRSGSARSTGSSLFPALGSHQTQNSKHLQLFTKLSYCLGASLTSLELVWRSHLYLWGLYCSRTLNSCWTHSGKGIPDNQLQPRRASLCWLLQYLIEKNQCLLSAM